MSDQKILSSAAEALAYVVECQIATVEWLRLLKSTPKSARKRAQKGYAEAGQVYHVLPGRSYGQTRDPDQTSSARFVLEQRRLSTDAHPLILFATTKAHWMNPSKLEWVDRCCAELVETVPDLGIRSVAVPALGCGEGRRLWPDVRPIILAAVERMTCERVEIYMPHEQRQRRWRRP